MEEKVEKNEKLWKFLTIYFAFHFKTKDLNRKKSNKQKNFFFCSTKLYFTFFIEIVLEIGMVKIIK